MKRFAFLEPFAVDGTMIMLRLFLAVAVIIFLIQSILAITFPYPLDYGEGPLLGQATQLAEGQNIYRTDISSPPYVIANYPPLYVLALVPYIKLFGPALQAGRVLSLLSTLATAYFLSQIIRVFSEDRFAATATGLIFLIIPFVVRWSGYHRVDMLALALSTAALYVLVSRPDQWLNLIGAGLLLVAAIYTRQSYALAAPLAAFIYLWGQERRRAIQLAFFVGGLSLLLFILLNIITGGGFFFNIVTANVNEFGFERLKWWLQNLAEVIPISLLLMVVFLFLAPRRLNSWSLLVPYLIGSFLSTLTIGKIGSYVNYFLELSAALSLIAGAFIYWSRKHPWRFAAILALLALQVGLLMEATLNDPVSGLAFRRRDEGALRELDEIIADTSDPVLADEYMGLITNQDRPLHIQPFEVTQLARDGNWDQTPVLNGINNHEYPLILIFQHPLFPLHEERWTPEMLAAIDENYRPSQTLAGNILYRPKLVESVSTTFSPIENPTFSPDSLDVELSQQIGQTPYMIQPYITVNPDNSDHLAATVMTSSDFECDLPVCQFDLLLYTSIDGGGTWSEQSPISSGRQSVWEGLARFGPEDMLYTLGIRRGLPVFNSASATAGYEFVQGAAQEIRVSNDPSKPWLVINPDNGKLYLSYAGRGRNNIGVRLNKSTDQGRTWSSSIEVDPGVPEEEIAVGRAIAADDVQVMIGSDNNLAAVWRWRSGPRSWPLGVWIATSNDDGETFSESRRIAQTWGPTNSAFYNGMNYVLYRTGTERQQKLAIAVSEDNGVNWEAYVISGELPLTPDFDKAPGIGIAPDGTIDIIFYANNDPTSDCVVSQEIWLQSFALVDTCTYDVLYTFSQDSGRTFSTPRRLNQTPVLGERFVRVSGRSVAFTHISVASSNEYAHPIWFETEGTDGMQLVTTRIIR